MLKGLYRGKLENKSYSEHVIGKTINPCGLPPLLCRHISIFMHFWQLQKGMHRRYDTNYMEFQAMAFDLAYSAHSSDLYSVQAIKKAIENPYTNDPHQQAGELFKRYFKERGYTVETLTGMSPEERQGHGIALLKMAKDERRTLFDFLEE